MGRRLLSVVSETAEILETLETPKVLGVLEVLETQEMLKVLDVEEALEVLRVLVENLWRNICGGLLGSVSLSQQPIWVVGCRSSGCGRQCSKVVLLGGTQRSDGAFRNHRV